MRWKRHTEREQAALHYAREFHIHELTAQVLLNRGFNGLESMRGFLNPDLTSLHDPFQMRNMEHAVRRIRRAVVKGERIHIHGDYDVDGITATAVIMLGLRAIGADVHYHIINRNDASVGLSTLSLERDHLPHRPSLIITADCGTSSHAGIELAKKNGVDVIVVDHHMPGKVLPKCVALLNPMQPLCEFPFPSLAAVGVAFNLVYALSIFLEKDDAVWPRIRTERLLDLVALGTISDLVPLADENRIFVREGLKLVRSARRAGVCALMRSARMLNGHDHTDGMESLSARTVGFRLAPLLNAAGRMNDANKCVELLITDSYRVADAIAQKLQSANSERQQKEREVLEQAIERAEAAVNNGANVLVLADKDWHPGVLGIVASRLVERYHRPSLVAAIDEQGMAKGSVRAPDGIDMLAALTTARDLLDTYGGHKVAAGVAFPSVGLEELRERLTAAVAEQVPPDETPQRSIDIDATVTLDTIGAAFIEELMHLAPFGAGNPEPVFEIRSAQPLQPKTVSGGNVRLRIRQGTRVVDAFGFGMGRHVSKLRGSIDLAVSPRLVKHSRGYHVELVVKDFLPSEG